MQSVNRVIVSGSITETTIRRKNVTYTIATDAAGRKAFPQFTQYDPEKDSSPYMPGDRVKALGHIQTISIRDHDAGEPVFQTAFVLDEIQSSQRALLDSAFGAGSSDLSGTGGWGGDANEVDISGKISYIKEYDNGAVRLSFVIPRYSQDEHGNPKTYDDRANIWCYDRQADTARTLAIGDYAATAGCVRMRANGNSSNWYIYCRDIARIKDNGVQAL